jgi:cardiolipin synthase C
MSSAQLLHEVIAELGAQLPAAHLAAWVLILQDTSSPDPDLQARLINAQPGYAISAKAARLVQAWRAAGPSVPGNALALALETAALMHARDADHRTEVVISGPTSDSVPLRLTSSVVTELIRDARTALLIVSFAAFGIADVINELEQATRRGVRIDLVLESTAAHGGTLHGTVEASAAFQAIRDYARFWVWPADHRPVVGTSRAALHAKLVAADEHIALVGSANLTDKALASNLELGVVVRDPAVVRRMVRHFRALMNPGIGPLELHDP